MKIRNISTIGTCFLLCAAMLAGCGSSSSSSSAVSSETASEESVSESEAASSEEASSSEESSEETSDSYYPVSVDTYSVSSDGATWTPVTAEYTSEPQRVVANNQGTANLMIRLGLGDKLVGVAAVYGPAPDDVADEFNSVNVIAQGYASKEAVLGVEPDFVAGRGDLFIDGDYGVGTTEELESAGIASYITHVGETGATFDSFLADIENLGTIFNVQDKAAELKEYYQNYVDDLKNDSRWAGTTTKMAEVSWIEDGMPVFGSAATETLQNEAFSMIGLDNINADCDGSQVSIETVIEENPAVIVLFDYEGGPDMNEMIQSLYDNEALQDIDAIKNKHVYSLDFSSIYGGGGDLYTEVSNLADQFYGS